MIDKCKVVFSVFVGTLIDGTRGSEARNITSMKERERARYKHT
jgi:hypothetical protein